MDQCDENTPACETCGMVFSTINHLIHHTKNTHWKQFSEEKATTDGMCREKDDKCEDTESSEEETDDEEIAFQNFRQMAADKVQDTEERQEAYEKFLAVGEDEDSAVLSANEELKDECIKEALEMYRQYLENGLLLQNGAVHNDVRRDLNDYWDSGYNATKAARLAVKKHRNMLEEFFEDDDDVDDDDVDDDDDDDEGSE